MLGFNITVGLIMVAAFISMIMCAKKQHENRAAKPAAIVLLVVVAACAIMVLQRNMEGGGATLLGYQRKYYKSSTYVLGKELASQMPGASVLVIVGDGDLDNPNSRLKSMIEGLKEGFGNDITDIKIENPKVTQPKGPEAEEMELPIEELVTAKDINTILTKHKDCKIIITFIGLPKDAGGLKLWEDFNNNPRTCQKLVMIGGNTSNVAQFINVGLIPAMVINHPNAKYTEDTPPSSLEDCFDKQYLLITKKNIKEVAQKYPNIFKTK
jgi:hypothetical protein